MLVKTINILYKNGTLIFIAITKRNEKTFEYFLNSCSEFKFNFENVTKKISTIDLFEYDKKNVEIYKLFK
jgi:hypothetical protein